MLNVLVFWAVSPLLEDGVGPILINLHADLPQNKRLLATLGRTAKSIKRVNKSPKWTTSFNQGQKYQYICMMPPKRVIPIPP